MEPQNHRAAEENGLAPVNSQVPCWFAGDYFPQHTLQGSIENELFFETGEAERNMRPVKPWHGWRSYA